MKLKLQKIYPITGRQLSGLSHSEQVKRFVDEGAGLVQLREKSASSREFLSEAMKSVEIAHSRGARLLINDRVDIARMSGADGVHLGQDDLPPEKARELLGDDAIIGFSTHSVEQAIAAVRLPIDYIAIGPIFPTKTKENPHPVVGCEGITAVRNAIGDFPVVAIGGITSENLQEVLDAGADSAAMISGLNDIRTLSELL